MKPKWTVFIQGLVCAVLCTVGLLILQDRAADSVLPLCGVGALIWSFFGISYWARRRSATPRSRHRLERDRLMLICFALGLGLPAALALLDLAIGPLHAFDPPLRGGQAVILTLSVCAVPLSMFVSSSVDWYLIRAFRDGVLGLPACLQRQQSAGGEAADYNRYWVMHRFVSEGVVFAAIIGVIAEVLAICTNAVHSQASQNAFNDVGLVGILGWSYASLAKLRPAIDFIRYPSECALGRWQNGRNEDGLDIQGFCLDASVHPGIQLLENERGYLADDIANPEQCVPLRQRKTLKFASPPATAQMCSTTECRFWIQHCEIGNRRQEARASVTSVSPPLH